MFGVTTELDMFTDHRFVATMRAEQQRADGALGRADILSAGTLVTSPKGHGTEYGVQIPTLASAGDAQAFVDARIAEGSDYIKIVYDDGAAYGMQIATIDRTVLGAAIDAAKKRGKLAVVHIGSGQGANDAIAAGASGLVHIFADAPADATFVARVAATRAFVTPTLSVTESTTGVASGAPLLKDARLAPFITVAERTSLEGRFPSRPGSKQNLAFALASTKRLFDAGVPILAGTDAPNPGTSHGSSLHRELELLVQAGLSPEAALAAATSVPARIYSLRDRGRVAPGLRADLVLVNGDPSRDITATRDIVSIWKRGVRLERAKAPAATAAAPAATTTGLVSDFDASADIRAEFGSGWQTSTDSLMGGKSTATLTVVQGGANEDAQRVGGFRHRRRGRGLSVGRRDVLPGRHADGAGRSVQVQGDRILGAGRRRRAPGHGLRRAARQHPGDATVHSWTRVARVRPAPRVVLEPRRLGPARRAILRRVEARAFPVHHRRGAVPVSTRLSAPCRDDARADGHRRPVLSGNLGGLLE